MISFSFLKPPPLTAKTTACTTTRSTTTTTYLLCSFKLLGRRKMSFCEGGHWDTVFSIKGSWISDYSEKIAQWNYKYKKPHEKLIWSSKFSILYDNLRCYTWRMARFSKICALISIKNSLVLICSPHVLAKNKIWIIQPIKDCLFQNELW